MPFPKIPPGITKLVASKFEKAKDSKALSYFPTQVDLLTINDTKFQLRFSEALANKPKGEKHNQGSNGQKPFDPFEDPPEALYVTDIEPKHKLVLNKFAIVPEHFILATKEFQEQTCLLTEDDLAATLSLIRAWRGEGSELFAFFNSGDHSGASQRHRHVQFLPVESMRAGLKQQWSPILDELVDGHAELPFATFAEKISNATTSVQLHELYLRLYTRACQYTNSSRVSTQADSEAVISYNLGMTDKAIVLCPRAAEGAEIGCGEQSGFVGLNGTLLAGTLLVKSEFEWDTLRKDPTQLHAILKAVSFPIKPKEYVGQPRIAEAPSKTNL